MHRNDMRPLSESRRKTLLAKSEPMGVGNGQSLGEGKFTAVVSTFNVVDSQGDMMLPHAFDDSIANFRARSSSAIIGRIRTRTSASSPTCGRPIRALRLTASLI